MQRAYVVGTGLGGELRYTTKELQEQEGKILDDIVSLLNARKLFGCFSRHQSIEKNEWSGEEGDESQGTADGGFSRWIRRFFARYANSERNQIQKAKHRIASIDASLASSLHASQFATVKQLCGDRVLQVVLNQAKSEKAIILQALMKRYQAAGYTVIGAALSSHASEHLGKVIGCRSETLSGWLKHRADFLNVQTSIMKWHPR